MDLKSQSPIVIRLFTIDANKEISEHDPNISTEHRLRLLENAWKVLPRQVKQHYFDLANQDYWVEH